MIITMLSYGILKVLEVSLRRKTTETELGKFPGASWRYLRLSGKRAQIIQCAWQGVAD